MLEAAANQQIPTRQNGSSSGIKSSGNLLNNKSKPNKKTVAYPVPTRKAPPPPARVAPSSHKATQAPSGNNKFTTATQDANKVIAILPQWKFCTDLVKLKNAKVNRSQPGS
jgi:hypothetical protein